MSLSCGRWERTLQGSCFCGLDTSLFLTKLAMSPAAFVKTNSLQHSPWKFSSCSASQEIFSPFWNPKFDYRVLCQMESCHTSILTSRLEILKWCSLHISWTNFCKQFSVLTTPLDTPLSYFLCSPFWWRLVHSVTYEHVHSYYVNSITCVLIM